MKCVETSVISESRIKGVRQSSWGWKEDGRMLACGGVNEKEQLRARAKKERSNEGQNNDKNGTSVGLMTRCACELWQSV